MSKTFKWTDVFQDPDQVGQSEYRAIHECIADAMMKSGDIGCEVEPDTTLNIQEAEHAYRMLEEFKDWAEQLQANIIMSRGLIKGDEFRFVEGYGFNPFDIYVVSDVVDGKIYAHQRDNRHAEIELDQLDLTNKRIRVTTIWPSKKEKADHE